MNHAEKVKELTIAFSEATVQYENNGETPGDWVALKAVRATLNAAIDKMQAEIDRAQQSEKEGWRYANELKQERQPTSRPPHGIAQGGCGNWKSDEMNYEDRIKLLSYRHIQALDRYAGMPESKTLDDYTEVVHPHRMAFMEAVEEAQREIYRLGALNSELQARHYEMDDVDRALVEKVKEAIDYDNDGGPARDVIDESEMLDAIRLLLQIIDKGHAA